MFAYFLLLFFVGLLASCIFFFSSSHFHTCFFLFFSSLFPEFTFFSFEAFEAQGAMSGWHTRTCFIFLHRWCLTAMCLFIHENVRRWSNYGDISTFILTPRQLALAGMKMSCFFLRCRNVNRQKRLYPWIVWCSMAFVFLNFILKHTFFIQWKLILCEKLIKWGNRGFLNFSGLWIINEFVWVLLKQ